MKLVIVVCNVCEDRDMPVKKYELKSEGRKAAVDLCETHGKPFEEFLPEAPKPAQKRTSTASRGRAATTKRVAPGRKSRVTTIEEIEAMKGA